MKNSAPECDVCRPKIAAPVEPAPANMHYDDWLAQRIEIAHRDFMKRTSRRLPCDMRIVGTVSP